MKYYKLIAENPKLWPSFKLGNIYPENTKSNFTPSTVKDFAEHLTPKEWLQVSEREYWQQELKAGRLVKGAYYTNSDIVIHKHSGTEDAEYYLNSSEKTFYRNGGNFTTKQFVDLYSLATEDEIAWLEACNKADKFIIKKDFMKSKENKMENKKIIGYKLVKSEYKDAALKISNATGNWENSLAEYDIEITQTRYIDKLKEAGVLDLWFEPVYEQKVKVGDYVYITADTSYVSKLFNGQVKKVTRVLSHAIDVEGADGGLHNHEFRLATPEEIKKATQVNIQGYKVNIYFDYKTIELGCKKFTFDEVKAVAKAINAGLSVQKDEADEILKLEKLIDIKYDRTTEEEN